MRKSPSFTRAIALLALVASACGPESKLARFDPAASQSAPRAAPAPFGTWIQAVATGPEARFEIRLLKDKTSVAAPQPLKERQLWAQPFEGDTRTIVTKDVTLTRVHPGEWARATAREDGAVVTLFKGTTPEASGSLLKGTEWKFRMGTDIRAVMAEKADIEWAVDPLPPFEGGR